MPDVTQPVQQTNHNFARALIGAADTHSHRDCLIVDPGPTAPGTVWSYADLGYWSQRMAGALSRLGVGHGDRVVVQVEKSPHAVALYLGCLRLGAVYVPLNTAYTAAEVGYFLGDAQPLVFVHAPQTDPAEAIATLPAGRGADALHTASLGTDGTGSLVDAAKQAEPYTGIEHCDAGDLAAILYTSGTTGRSKGAMLSHLNLAMSARGLREAWGWRDDDVLLHALPIFHVHGLFVALHCALLGATPVLFLSRFDAAVVAAVLPRATVMMGVPTFYTRLLERPEVDRARCAGVRLFISGSAPLTEQAFDAWEAQTGQRILERYGMSETMINTSNPLAGDRVAGTVGFALPGVQARIADDDGNEVPRGAVGTIEVRGANVFAGYWRMPEKTAEEFRAEGWFITGDLGTMDEDGRIAIVGRAKDLVISGGYNVYPKEIERLLDEMPGVAESAVIGVPHADFGEAVVAVLVCRGSRLTERDISAALFGKLARFKQPKAVVCVDALPRNAMGKVQKNELRDRYVTLFDG